jgi:hypothetical protein
MGMTDRQAIVQHYAEKGIKFEKPVDMAINLARDAKQSRPVLAKQKEYVEKVLKAGYTSKMATDLFDDINNAEKPKSAKSEKSE